MQNTTQPINDGGSAFPIPYVVKPDGSITHCEDGFGQGGMRLRDWLVGQVISGMLANQKLIEIHMQGSSSPKDVLDSFVLMAFQTADAIIDARNKSSN